MANLCECGEVTMVKETKEGTFFHQCTSCGKESDRYLSVSGALRDWVHAKRRMR